ncbi:E3 ubiquitin-protein ligase RNF10-like [Styela clava]
MSICPYSKNTKPSTQVNPASNNNKKNKDERSFNASSAANISKVTPKKTYYENKRGSADFLGNRSSGKGNWRGKGEVLNRKSHKYERYASGSSYLKPDGNVKETTKKISLNHLLNFKFESRNAADEPISNHIRYNKNNRKSSHGNAFSRERFLQANCEFIVSEDGDYSVHYVDPDVLVPWDKVKQVRVKSEKDWFCPICLYPPSVAKITKCGHIYCWPCILHYLALEDKKSGCRECPICQVDVRNEDLRSVVIEEEAILLIGSEITMELLYRPQDSLIPKLLSESAEISITKDTEALNRRTKISKYSPVQVLDLVIELELEELKSKLAEDLDDLEKIFVQAAITECEDKKTQLIGEISQQCDIDVKSLSVTDSELCRDDLACKTEMENPISPAADNISSSDSSNVSGRVNARKKPSAYYFYQQNNGEHIYLNGINVKCLLKEYGSFQKCPSKITGELVNVERFVMTEELRKRHKYLSHLPLSCEYRIVELDLHSPIISEETLQEFEGQIKQRKVNRQRKEREENASRRKAEIQERQRLQDFIRSQSSGQSYQALANSASTGSVSVFVTSSEIPSPNLSQNSSSASMSPHYGTSPAGHHDSDTKSFAEMLKLGEACAFKPVARRQQFPIQSTPLKTEYNNNVTKAVDEDDQEDPFYVAPTYKSSFGDALSMALDAIDASASTGKVDAAVEKQSKKKQKRKKKQTLLFSTSSQLHHL